MDEENFTDEELSQLAKQLASTQLDEEIAHHPELFPQRETLLRSKSKRIEKEIKEKNNDLFSDLNSASILIKDYFLSLPPTESEPLLEKLSHAQQLLEEEIPQDPNKTLQEKLALPEEILQAIYSFAIDLQKKERHKDAADVLKFLIVLNPLISDFWIALGFSQLCLNFTQEALKSFSLSLTNDPSNLRSYYFIAYTHRLLNDEASSLAITEEALALKDNPTYSEWEPTFTEIKSILLKKELV
jgi:tetratricopeptide (TPR) repeat protein